MSKVKTQYILEGKEAGALKALGNVQDRLTKAERKMADLGRAAKQTQKSHGEFSSSAVSGLASMVTSVISVTAAIGAARQAFSLWKQDIEETSEATRNASEAMMEYFFMGRNVRDPGFAERMRTGAKAAGVTMEEYGPGIAMWQSMTGGMGAARRGALWQEVVQHRQATRLTLSDLVPLYAKTAGMYPELTPNQLQNFIKLAVETAAVTEEQLPTQFPRVLAAGRLAGMQPAELGAAFAQATAATGTARRGATGMRAAVQGIMQGVRGPGGRMLRRMGVRPGMDFLERVDALRAAWESGRLDEDRLKQLVGQEGLYVAARFLKRPEEFQTFREMFLGTAGRDIMGERIAAGREQPWYRATIESRRAAAGLEIERGRRLDALEAMTWRDRAETMYRELGWGGPRRWLAMKGWWAEEAGLLAPAQHRQVEAWYRRQQWMETEGRALAQEFGRAARMLIEAAGSIRAHETGKRRTAPGGE